MLGLIRFLSEIKCFNRLAVDRDVVDQRKAATAQSTSENSAPAPKKSNTIAADTSFASRYNVVNGGPNKELYKGPNEDLLL